MPINQQAPNSQSVTEDIESISNLIERSVDSIDELSISSLYAESAGRTPAGKFLRERAVMLRGLVNEIDRPILKGFATQMLDTMAGWFEDPEVLCCLINAIWTSYQASQEQQGKTGFSVDLKVADTDFGDWLDTLIVFIDFIIAFLTRDLKQLVLFIPDFIKELFGAVMGAILLILQETLYTIRDSVLQSVLDWIDESVDAGALWAGCLPMQQFLDIIKRYVSDYGLFAEIMAKIRGWLSGKKSDWSKQAASLVGNTKDLEFLYWLRDLLIKLKQAVINFDLCVEYAYVPDNNYAGDPATPPDIDVPPPPLGDDSYNGNPDAPASQRVPLIVGDDGRTVTISETDSRLKDGDIPTTSDRNNRAQNGTYISRLSNDSIANFIKQNYGFSNDVVEQAMNRTTDGCPGFPGDEDLKSYLERIRNRNI